MTPPLVVLEPGERAKAGPFEIETIHMSHSIPDARAVALHTKLGAILITGDYRFDQTPVDGRPADIARLAELGSEGVLCLCGDSTNADRPGVGASERERWPRALRGVRALRGAHHRHLLRVERPPRPAGDRRRGRARPQGRAGRALDEKELQHRLEPRDGLGARRGLHQPEGDRELPGRPRDRDLDGQPGRAALGAQADGVQRPPRRRAPLGRHDHLLGDRGARQRARGERDDRPHLRDRRIGRHRRRRAHPRLGPRLARGAEADAQPDAAQVRDAVPRRPQADPPPRRARRVGRGPAQSGSSRAATA